MSEYSEQPSTLSRFTKGAMSGAFSGALMMGVVGLVGLAAGAVGIGFGASLPVMALMVTCTSLFGGIMAAVRGGHGAAPPPREIGDVEALTPAISQSRGVMPQVGLDTAEDMAAPARADGRSWTEVAGKTTGTPSRIDSILADGAMTDKDRASAILAAREATSTEALR